MAYVQDNIELLKDALEEVKSHCMCLKFEEDATHFRVIYPEGYFPEGVQASKGMGKVAALHKITEVMERHWKENY